MKLYYSPGACSLASHIALQETGLPYAAVAVDLKNKTSPDGDFKKINPKGSVPALRLDDGRLLTENAVILQYVADQKPAAKLIPAFGTFERYQCLEWLNYMATEVHKNFSPLFKGTTSAEAKDQALATVATKLAFVAEKLADGPFLLGKAYSVADAYLFTMLTWARGCKMDLSRWPVLMGFYETVAHRPAVHATMQAEGLPS